MKKIIIIPLLIAVIGAFGQTFTKVKSVALADSIWKPKGGVEVTPFIINAATDTIRTVLYDLDFSRDTTKKNSIVTVTGYSKAGIAVASYYTFLDQTTYAKWKALITPLDVFIHNKFPRVTILTP